MVGPSLGDGSDALTSIRPASPEAAEAHARTVELASGEGFVTVPNPGGAEDQPQHGTTPSETPYQLIARIGEGGMGEVWEARQHSLGRHVAYKQLRAERPSTPLIVRQFESEARLTGALDHPNIIPVHELSRDADGRTFYTMQLIQGSQWREAVDSKSRDLRDHLEILEEVCNAVAFAHSRGVIHRDIKPGNVMVGDFGEVWLVDWGLALALRPLAGLDGAETWTLAALPSSSLICGTPAYMSPETAAADRELIGLQTDVYLLGAVLFHLLYGRPPYQGHNVEQVLAQAKANSWSIPDALPRGVEAWDVLLRPIVTRAMASEPSRRFDDAGEFGDALRVALRNYDSAKVANRARRELGAMRLAELEVGAGYHRLNGLIARLEEALESWPGNVAASETLAQAQLQLAELALANGDLALARSSLRGVGQEDSADLQGRLEEQEGRGRRRRWTLRALGSLALVSVVSTSVLVVSGGQAARERRRQAERERDHYSHLLLEQAANTTEAQLGGLFDPVHGALTTAVVWGEAGQLDSEDPRVLNQVFMPLLEGIPAATSALRADAEGREYMLLRLDEGWATRSGVSGEDFELGTWDARGELLGGEHKTLDYDSKTRPWYTGAVTLEEGAPFHWTSAYTLFTTKEPGISVSAAIESSSGRHFVVALDVKLVDISAFTQRLPEGGVGQVFVLDEDLRVLGLPKESAELSAELRASLILTPMAELREAPISRLAFLAWQRRGRPDKAFRLPLTPSGPQWVHVRRLTNPDRPELWIGVVAPESRITRG